MSSSRQRLWKKVEGRESKLGGWRLVVGEVSQLRAGWAHTSEHICFDFDVAISLLVTCVFRVVQAEADVTSTVLRTGYEVLK